MAILNKEFMKFVFIGCVNTFIGVVLSAGFAYFLTELSAFLCGYAVSLLISYFLNSTYVFQENYSVKKLIRFICSYIPNFLIQVITVYLLVDKMNVPPIIIYALSACISVPITFIMLKLLTFKRKEDKHEEDF